jgi:hypothetical protein
MRWSKRQATKEEEGASKTYHKREAVDYSEDALPKARNIQSQREITILCS